MPWAPHRNSLEDISSCPAPPLQRHHKAPEVKCASAKQALNSCTQQCGHVKRRAAPAAALCLRNTLPTLPKPKKSAADGAAPQFSGRCENLRARAAALGLVHMEPMEPSPNSREKSKALDPHSRSLLPWQLGHPNQNSVLGSQHRTAVVPRLT